MWLMSCVIHFVFALTVILAQVEDNEGIVERGNSLESVSDAKHLILFPSHEDDTQNEGHDTVIQLEQEYFENKHSGISEKVAGLGQNDKTPSGRFEELKEKFDENIRQSKKLQTRFQELGENYEKLAANFDKMSRRFEDLEGKYDNLEERYKTLEDRNEELSRRYEEIDGRYIELKLRYGENGVEHNIFGVKTEESGPLSEGPRKEITKLNLSTIGNNHKRNIETDTPKNHNDYTVVKENENQINTGRSLRQEFGNVAFYVYLSENRCYSNHETIVFDVEETDIGNNYNVHDGIFDVPTTGTYVFTLMVASKVFRHIQAEIVVDGTVKGVAFADTSDISDMVTSTATIVVRVNAGDHVFVRKGPNSFGNCDLASDYLKPYGNHVRTTFSGWKLF